MTPDAARERLIATHEQLYGTMPLDLDERTTIEGIRMDRAERIARENAKGTDRTEKQIQRRIWWRRFARNTPLMLLKVAAGAGATWAANEIKDRVK